MPAAAVIPALHVYAKVAAVKTLLLGNQPKVSGRNSIPVPFAPVLAPFSGAGYHD